jgi:4-hydroxy-3-methylbut-2-en-1-yl diphosphate reductase
MKTFQVPVAYRSPIITAIKNKRRAQDKMKKDFSPFLLDFGSLQIFLARHFGFCYGVENAIDIAFRTVEENPGRNIFLLSEMIHNPQVNRDLLSKGIRFLQDTAGKQLIPFENLVSSDIVITPAFGTSLEIDALLKSKGIHTENYNTTCPFVEKVWNRSGQIAEKKFTVIIHGKPGHEETRATFSHASAGGPALVIKDMEEAVLLGNFIVQKSPPEQFFHFFEGRYSLGFDPARDLQTIGVVNQTTMLASDTQQIADFLKQRVEERPRRPDENPEDFFADTRDTLCYATNDNQSAVLGMLASPAELAVVVGGYNSSNTSHLVELCEKKLPTYFIEGPEKLISTKEILHFDLQSHQEILSGEYLEKKIPLRVLLTSGASCPDALVEEVIYRLCHLVGIQINLDDFLEQISREL